MQAIIIDHHGNHWGPFESGVVAAKWAQRKWPGQDEADDNSDGWRVVALWAPDTPFSKTQT